MTDGRKAQNIVEAAQALLRKGLVQRTFGNISMRVSDHSFLITPSGRRYETMTADDIVDVDIVSLAYKGTRMPSGEKALHATVYKESPKATCIVHTHQTFATAISILGTDIKIDNDTTPTASYAYSGSEELASNVGKKVIEHPGAAALLMRYHGVVLIGGENEEPTMLITKAEQLEDAMRTKYRELCGIDEKTTDEEIVDICQKFFAEQMAGIFLSDFAMMYDAVDDEKTVSLIKQKNMIAAYLGAKTGIPPIAKEKAAHEHQAYVSSYQNLANS